MNFMRDPLSPSPSTPPATPPPPQANPEENWSDVEGKENIIHLTSANFDTFMQEQPSVLVMFYAPCEFLHLFTFQEYFDSMWSAILARKDLLI